MSPADGVNQNGLAPEPPVIGLIALDRDVVIENDVHSLLPSCVTVTTRIRLGEVGSIRHLRLLAESIPDATRMLASANPSLIAFGCTSGVAAIGTGNIDRAIEVAGRAIPSCDPLRGILDGLTALEAKAISLITPYGSQVSELLSDWFRQSGLDVSANTRIDPGTANHYAAIGRESILEAVERSRTGDTEALVIACTDLRVLHLIDGIEDALGVPVLSSNQALAWSISRAVGSGPIAGPGRLFENNS